MAIRICQDRAIRICQEGLLRSARYNLNSFQIMSKSGQGSEYYITIFSNEGRLYQVEYAFKAVKTCGLTAIAIRGRDSVVLLSEKKVQDRFIDAKTVTNIHNVTSKIGTMTIGLVPDSKNILTRLQMEAAHYKREMGHDIPVDYLASRLADHNQITTQKAMQRVFGVETIVAGIDAEKGPTLYKIDPAGYYFGYKGVSAGVKEQDAINYLEKEMKKSGWDLSEEDSVKLAITCMQTVIGQEFKSNDIEIGVVSVKNPKFTKLSPEQIEFYLNEVSKKD